jgi:hypothetical protein
MGRTKTGRNEGNKDWRKDRMNKNKNKKTQEISERKAEQTQKSRLLVQLMQMASEWWLSFHPNATHTEGSSARISLFIFMYKVTCRTNQWGRQTLLREHMESGKCLVFVSYSYKINIGVPYNSLVSNRPIIRIQLRNVQKPYVAWNKIKVYQK